MSDTVIKNGKLYSVDINGNVTKAESVVINNGKIEAICTDDEIEKYIEEGKTLVIDANGGSILPGFCDAHIHATFSSSVMYSCNLFHVSKETNDDKEALINKYKNSIERYMQDNPDASIIRGTGWNMGHFGYSIDKIPTRFDLDEISTDKPIVLESFCQHHLWVNSKALELAGINKDTVNPRNGNLWKDENGDPIGVLSEFAAMNILKYNLANYDYTVEQYKEVLKKYQHDYANKFGVTQIFDALCTDNARNAYKELAAEGELTIRVSANHYADPNYPKEYFDDIVSNKGKDDIGDIFRINCVKFFMEGSGTDMYLGKPYETEYLKESNLPEDHTGTPYWTPEELNELFVKFNEADIQIHAHAMGDQATTYTLDALEYSFNKSGKRPRNTIAHLMYVKDSDFERMKRLKVIACVQPTWMGPMAHSYKWYIDLLGKKRAMERYPYKRFLDDKIVVSMGTDFPVIPSPDPFVEIQTAMTRKLPKKSSGYEMYKDVVLGPKEDELQDAVTFKDAIQSLTVSGAYQNYFEEITGSIEVGKSAELVVLDRDIESIDIGDICESQVKYTLFKGSIVYEK